MSIYDKTDKQRLYWIMDMYLSGKIDEATFCDEFYYSYDLELDYSSLTKEEYEAFSELGKVAGRFSEFDRDHKKYPKFFRTKEELKQKILETKKKLKK